jgi:hypothetical protein
LLQGLVTAATERGYTVTAASVANDRYGRRESSPIHLRFHVRGHDVGLTIAQESDRGEHLPTAGELARQKRDSWYKISKYEYSPSERLKISLAGWFEHQQTSWADGAKISLDDKLGEILQQMEIFSDLAERKRRAEEERERQREVEEQRRVARAKARLIESHRADVLDAQLSAWRKARELDDFLVALAGRISQIEDPEAVAAANAWLTWAKDYRERLDPLNQTIAMPPDPEPTSAALAPFMEHRYSWL